MSISSDQLTMEDLSFPLLGKPMILRHVELSGLERAGDLSVSHLHLEAVLLERDARQVELDAIGGPLSGFILGTGDPQIEVDGEPAWRVAMDLDLERAYGEF